MSLVSDIIKNIAEQMENGDILNVKQGDRELNIRKIDPVEEEFISLIEIV